MHRGDGTGKTRSVCSQAGAYLTLLLYWSQLVSCSPSAGGLEEGERFHGGPWVTQTARLQDTSLLEVPSDTLVASPAQASTATTPYSTDVSGDGAASVSIPLWAPEGRAGLQPNLSIAYNSRSPDGPLGVGFNLSGMSQITHCSKTLTQDGVVQALDLDASWRDARYCLDGERLVLVSDPNGTAPPEFRTENDSYARVVIEQMGAGAVPRIFRAYTREGLILTFGATGARSDGIFSGGVGGPIAWAQTVVTDRAGNRLDVFYEKGANPGALGAWIRPDRILYTSFVKPGAGGVGDEPALRSVKFRYQPRPDVFLGFIAGAKVRRDFRLSSIEMRGPDASGAEALLRTYTLQYSNGSLSKRSLLSEIKECDGQDICNLPVRFDWEPGSWEFDDQDAGEIQQNVTDGGLHVFGVGAGRYALGYLDQSVKLFTEQCGYNEAPCYERFDPRLNPSFNREHWHDVFRLHVLKDAALNPWQIEFPYGNSTWDSLLCPTRPSLRPVVVDWEGFGKSSLASFSCRVGEFTVNGLDVLETQYGYRHSDLYDSVWGSSRSVYWLDMNGDGLNDMAYIGSPPQNTADRVGVRLGGSGVKLQTASRVFTRPSYGLRAVDLDGSGRMSLVGPSEADPTHFTSVSEAQNSGALVETPTQFTTPFWFGSPAETPLESLFDFVDVNGDGLADAVSMGRDGTTSYFPRVEVQYNDGKRGAVDATVWKRIVVTDQYIDKRTGDFDGDGRTDMLVVLPHRVLRVVRAGSLGEFTEHQDLSLVAGDNLKWLQVADVNGDGLLDITRRVGNRLRVAVRKHGSDVLLRVHGGTRLPDGQGFSGINHTFEYASLSSRCDPAVSNCDPQATLKVYTSSVSDDAGVRQAMESTRVVRRMSLNLGAEPQRSWRFFYKDGRQSVRGHGWLGFAERTRMDEQSGEVTTTTYGNTLYPLCTDLLGLCLPGLAHQPLKEVSVIPTQLSAPLQEQQRRVVEWKYALQQPSVGRYQRYARLISEKTELLRQGQAPTPLSNSERVVTLDAHGNTLTSILRVRDADSTQEVAVSTSNVTNNPTTGLPQGTWRVTRTWAKCGLTAPEVGCGSVDPQSTQVMDFTFDDKGRLSVREREPESREAAIQPQVSELYLKTTLSWNDKGMMSGFTREGGGQTRTESVVYDGWDQVYPRHVVDSAGGVTRFAFHPGLGVLAQTADPNGARTRYQYDGFGRVRASVPSYKASAAVCNRTSLQQHYEWENGLPRVRTSLVVRDTATTQDCDGGGGQPGATLDESSVRFDGLGRPVQEKVQGFEPTRPFIYTDFKYNARDAVVSHFLPRFQAEIPDSAPAATGVIYDNLERVTSQTMSGGGTRGLVYSASAYSTATVLTDADGRKGRRIVDQHGLLTESVDAFNSAQQVSTKYQYGAFNRLVRIVDAKGSQLNTTFNRLGQPVRTEDPNAGVRLHAYNAFGELKWEADGEEGDAGRSVTTHAYDVLGRVSQTQTRVGSVVKETTLYTWDTAQNGFGKLAFMSAELVGSPVVATAYAYDSLGRQVSVSQRIGEEEILTVTQTHDAQGRRDSVSYPQTGDGRQFKIKYDYSAKGDLIAVRNAASGQAYWTGLERDVNGQVTRERLGQDIERVRRYDVQGQVRLLEAKRGGVNVQRLLYEYTQGGNLTARHDHVLKSTEKFEYDPLDRLELWTLYQQDGACRMSTNRYVYDEIGNLLARNIVAGTGTSMVYSYSEPGLSGGPHAVKKVSQGGDVLRFNHDRRGNQTLKMNGQTGSILRSVEYTSFDLPQRIQEAGNEVDFVYDAKGSRARKRSSGGSGSSEVVYLGNVYQRQNKTTHVFEVPGPDGVVAEVVWQDHVSEERTRFFLNDRLGTPDTLLSSLGGAAERLKYDPFGARRRDVNLTEPATAPLSGGRVGFTGHEQDDELGLINMRGRMYDPRLGRFLSPDPVLADPTGSQSFNAYAYVLNNPLRYTDPSGFSPYYVSGSYGGSDIGVGTGVGLSLATGFVPWAVSKLLGSSAPGSGSIRTDDATAAVARHTVDGGSSLRIQTSGSTASVLPWGSASEIADSWMKRGHKPYRQWLLEQIQPGNSRAVNSGLAQITVAVELFTQVTDVLRLGEGTAEGGFGGVAEDALRVVSLYGGLSGFALKWARGLGWSRATTAAVPEAAVVAPAVGWKPLPKGLQIRRIGKLWVKRVDPNATGLMRAWGEHSLSCQVRALTRLQEMATPFSYRNGLLILQDVGPTATRRTFLKAYLKGSRRIGYVNDIKPRNMGENGLIFDPAMDYVDKSLIYGAMGGAASTVGYLGYRYYEAMQISADYERMLLEQEEGDVP
ncbi:RHS repeat-associated core domain-containing protein [Corallococcus terminator]|uniref:Teneurin-like YD-shell domain-containing protein n=1 Tax=Corallococcus terminator TaxID=2316733 RepID=A0A3A8I3R2_9BACT|nr:RHS repeat-associated core domain-containing protein [Corallococcus terminator]RKG77962.1 hypothetical protein D7V88_30370 [Corallococcus terminator]